MKNLDVGSSSVAASASPPVAPVAATHPATPPSAAAAFFKEGLAFLRGSGAMQDTGLAAARLLDAADLNHPAALFFCALLYDVGVGVTRNKATASEYAARYLEQQSSGKFAEASKALIDGSLGTENARNLLFQTSSDRPGPAAMNEVVSGPKTRWPLVLAVAVPLLGIGALTAYQFAREPASSLDAVENLRLDQLLDKTDLEQAHKDALALAAQMQAQSAALQQERQAAEEARAKAEQAQRDMEAREAALEQQRLQAEALAKAEHEAAMRKAEEQRRQDNEARQAAARTQQTQQQVNNMLASARTAIRQGQLDRANGLVDAAMAANPNDPEAQALKQHIRQVRAQAIQNLQIR